MDTREWDINALQRSAAHCAQPEAIAAHSAPPYVATFKENGCIIFIAALDARSLVVCSKHSLGARPDTERSHAQVGEAWLARHLAAAGRTREALAAELYARNMTAVAEVRLAWLMCSTGADSRRSCATTRSRSTC